MPVGVLSLEFNGTSTCSLSPAESSCRGDSVGGLFARVNILLEFIFEQRCAHSARTHLAPLPLCDVCALTMVMGLAAGSEERPARASSRPFGARYEKGKGTRRARAGRHDGALPCGSLEHELSYVCAEHAWAARIAHACLAICNAASPL